jgi:hypothetical protein
VVVGYSCQVGTDESGIVNRCTKLPTTCRLDERTICMADEPTSLLLEGVNRLTEAIADLMEAHAQQSGSLLKAINGLEQPLVRIENGLGRVERDIHAVSAGQASLGVAVESSALARALRGNIWAGERDAPPPAQG